MKATIDLKDVYGADDLYQLLAEYIAFPDYFGNNLDALFDVFTEISEETEITFTGGAEAEAVMGKFARSFKKMCARASEENPCLHISFDA
ncbi:MAG: barstar family protein [Lachnospiraceae bacterium]|nr:barstar family protein [Lachnospiraceae bacterium]